MVYAGHGSGYAISMSDPVRKLAYEILLRFERRSPGDRLKADALIQQGVQRHPGLDERDRAFLTALVMGTLRRWLALDYAVESLAARPLKKLKPEVRVLLRLGLFQLWGLSQVPDHAALHATVDVARRVLPKAFREPSLRLINAVLRAAQRTEPPLPPPRAEDPVGFLSLHAALPAWWIARLMAHYGPQQACLVAEACLSPPPCQVRVNTLRLEPAAYQEHLAAQGIASQVPDLDVPEVLLLPDFSGDPRRLPGFEAGECYPQNLSSARVARLLAPRPGERILDLCAAPGSKTTHMAALMQNTGFILAVEPQVERVRRLEENLARLQVTNVRVLQANGLELPSEEANFDRVLVDAPCSGSGTMRRNPEIALQLSLDALPDFENTQQALLAAGYARLKPGGLLAYSTCSMEPEENGSLIRAFLGQTPEARLEGEYQQLLGPVADGFYIALIRKPASPA